MHSRETIENSVFRNHYTSQELSSHIQELGTRFFGMPQVDVESLSRLWLNNLPDKRSIFTGHLEEFYEEALEQLDGDRNTSRIVLWQRAVWGGAVVSAAEFREYVSAAQYRVKPDLYVVRADWRACLVITHDEEAWIVLCDDD